MDCTAYNPITLVQSDWSRFLTEHGLTEKCGVPASQFPFMLLKELCDNAADTGGGVITRVSDDEIVIRDYGRGIDASDVIKMFSIKRDLTSSKHWRRGERGALGNGLRAVMGAIYVLGGNLTIAARGVATTITVDDSGNTVVLEQLPAATTAGTTITVRAPGVGESRYVERAGMVFDELSGSVMRGKPSPRWFGVADIEDLLRSAQGHTVAQFVDQFATTYVPVDGGAPAALANAEMLLAELRAASESEPDLEALGKSALTSYAGYHRASGVFSSGGAVMPYIVEVWASATEGTGEKPATVLVVNRSAALSDCSVTISNKGRISVESYVLTGEARDKHTLRTTVDFEFVVSVTTPFMPILSSGKKPDINEFAVDIIVSVCKAGRQAQNEIKRRSLTGTSVVDAVKMLLPEAYDKVSEGGRYWANARQLMYAMRPQILAMTGKTTVGDGYITANLIPSYINDNPESADWKIAYDARGHFIEPHTRRSVALGTVSVGDYRDSRYGIEANVRGDDVLSVPPHHRLSGLLFIEKEGFSQNIEESGILERYDLALASTKGMSNIAIRQLIDHLAGQVEQFTLYTLTDFDIAGVTIEGTLVSDGWRYQYQNRVRHVPLAVDWALAQELHEAGLSEPAGRDNADAHAGRLKNTGLDPNAVEFLTQGGDTGGGLRVELNAIMPADLLRIIEGGVAASFIGKVIPDDLTGYWHELSIRQRLRQYESQLRSEAMPTMPADLRARAAELMEVEPTMSWDVAVAVVAAGEAA